MGTLTTKEMNTMNKEALTYALAGVATAAAVWFFAGVRINVTSVDATLAWVTAGALLAMAPLDYKRVWKRVFGR